ncbi:hypothetical protein PV10_04931 [Exophiala mesophila]|uniref:Protein phosphatase n=1 Tax=Exophiala mesophila TaxID=212818 RepID=A0A0D2A401_EXOME|nr:uncharacterized protein PV10_04931 [Exophiala mesophila]KIV93738.1 hypothetical protein PV10_04931 [Exophiala mesophila]
MLTQVIRPSRHTIHFTTTLSVESLLSTSSRLPKFSPAPSQSHSKRPCTLSHRSFHVSSQQLTGSDPQQRAFFTYSSSDTRRHLISEGRTTTHKDDQPTTSSSPSASPFFLETGYSIFAKRPSRAFPPPFVSLPSGSFSDPLTTHNNPVRGRRPSYNGEPIRGITNGDDAILIGDQNFLAVNDGVGAWAQKERGHAALWSRLIAHFWAVEIEKSLSSTDSDANSNGVKLEDLDPIKCLQTAYEETKLATKGRAEGLAVADAVASGAFDDPKQKTSDLSPSTTSSKKSKSKSKDNDKDNEKDPFDILGTTTASSALLYHKPNPSPPPPDPVPVILATSLGDCKVLIVRPSTKSVIYRSTEQWHWFDCPRQLGTNSPDTPLTNGVTEIVDVQVNDMVAVLSDGVTDNLWEHEISDILCQGVELWEGDGEGEEKADANKDGIVYVARKLMNAAREIATDPNAESPYMERAFDEGIAAEGGKLDDISVVLGIVRKRKSPRSENDKAD